ncbi:hypothetical protein KFL_000230280 [Klebsormidium nitens]|uniref:Uncharacterized protein n=1 Tax=Klebsormidium nitens TaxID=105231 RepID=A0A1Y1HPB6_KLENI|nr:hypothetical protein KFL_000230280 [Klebsormidium nitens]|eukprot:GAQ79049.1 hypothetical protein KFL_000230280 [Klebsormidium nitens]
MEGNKRGETFRPVSARAGSRNNSRQGPKQTSETAPIVGRRITNPTVSWNLGALTARVTQPVSESAGEQQAVSDQRRESAGLLGAERTEEVPLELGAERISALVEGNREALYQQRLLELRQKALDIMNGNRASELPPSTAQRSEPELGNGQHIVAPPEANGMRIPRAEAVLTTAKVQETAGKKPVQKSPPQKKQIKANVRPLSSLLKESQDRLANIHRLLDAATEESLFAPQRPQTESAEKWDAGEEAAQSRGPGTPAGGSIPFVIQPAGPPPDYVSPELVHIIQANAPDHLDLVDPTTTRKAKRDSNGTYENGAHRTAPKSQQFAQARQANSPVRVGAVLSNDGKRRRAVDAAGDQELRFVSGRSERAAKVEALLVKIQERNSKIAVQKAATEEGRAANQGLLRQYGGSLQNAGADQNRVGNRSPDRGPGGYGDIRGDEGMSGGRASVVGRSRSAPHQRPVSRGATPRKGRRSSDDSELGGRIATDGAAAVADERAAGQKQTKPRVSTEEASGLPGERKAAWAEKASGKLKPKRKFAGTRARPAGVNIPDILNLQGPGTVSGGVEVGEKASGAVLSTGVSTSVRLTEFGQSVTSPTLSGWSQDEVGVEHTWLYSANSHGLAVNKGDAHGIAEQGLVGAEAGPAGRSVFNNAGPKQGLASLAQAATEGPVLAGVGERPAFYPGELRRGGVEQGLEEGGQLASPLVQTFALGRGLPTQVPNELDNSNWGGAESAKTAPLVGVLVNGGIPSVLGPANAGTTVGIALAGIQEKAREQVRSALAKRPQSAPSVKRPSQNSKPQSVPQPHPIFGARSHPFLRAPPSKGPFTPPSQLSVNRPPGERRKSTGGADLAGAKRPLSAQSRLGGEEAQELGTRKSRLSGERLDEVRAFMIAQQKARKTQEAREREMRRAAEEERSKQLKALEQHYPKVSPKPSPPKTRPDWNTSVTPPEHTPPPQQNDHPETDSVLAEQGTVLGEDPENIATRISAKTSVPRPGIAPHNSVLNAASKPGLSILPGSAPGFAAGFTGVSTVVRRAGTRVQPLPSKTALKVSTAESVEATLKSWVGGHAVKRPPSEATKPLISPARSPVTRAKPPANPSGVQAVRSPVRDSRPVRNADRVPNSETVRKPQLVRTSETVQSPENVRFLESSQHLEPVRKLADLSGAPVHLLSFATLANLETPMTSAWSEGLALISAGVGEGAELAGDDIVEPEKSVGGIGLGANIGTPERLAPRAESLGAVPETVLQTGWLDPGFAANPSASAEEIGDRRRPSLTVDITGAVADAVGVALSGRATMSGRKRGEAVEEERPRSPIPDAKARLAMMKEYGRQQRQRRAALDAVRRKKEHERKLAAQALRRKQAERARQAEAARKPRSSGTRPESGVRRSSRPSVSSFIAAKRKKEASERSVRSSERALKASEGAPIASDSAHVMSDDFVMEGGGGTHTAINWTGYGMERMSVKSPPLRGQRPANWPDGRRSVRTQAPVPAHPEVSEEGPFSDGNRGGTRHVITEGIPVHADVSEANPAAPQGRPGTAPSRIAGTFVRTLGAVRTERSERQGELLSPWSVPSIEESLLFDGTYEEVPRGRSGRALSATKMLQSDGPVVMTWQRPEPRQGGWVGGSESEIAESDVRTGVEKFLAAKPRVKRNGKPVRGLVKKVSVPKEASFASDFDADTESLTPDSVVDAASEPDRLRRRLARKRRGAKWPHGEGWEREVLAKAETDRRLDVLKEMAARIAKRLEALAFSGGEGSRAELAPEIEAIVGQAEKLLRGVDSRGRNGDDDPPGKAKRPKKKRKGHKRGVSESRALGGLGSPLASKRLSASPEKTGARSRRKSIEAAAEKGPRTGARSRDAAPAVADVTVTSLAAASERAFSDDASLFSPVGGSENALSVGVNSDRALRHSPNVQTARGFSHPFPEIARTQEAMVTEQASEQEGSESSAADDYVTSDGDEGDDVIADLDAEIQQLLQQRRLAPAARVGTDSESPTGAAEPAVFRNGAGKPSAEQRWASLVGTGERSASEGSEEEMEEESSEGEEGGRVAPLADVSKGPRGLVQPTDVSRGAQGLLSDLYSDSEEDDKSDTGPSKSADGLTSHTRGASVGQIRVSKKPAGQVPDADVSRGSADVSTEQKKVTVKQLLEASGDALLEEAVPVKIPPLTERIPAETKGDRLSIVHLYEKQLRERMERQQRQLAELERKRKEDERKRKEDERKEREDAERNERAEREERAERDEKAKVAEDEWEMPEREKESIEAATERKEETRREEERKQSEQERNEKMRKKDQERRLEEAQKIEEEERNEVERRRKSAEELRESVRQPAVEAPTDEVASKALQHLVSSTGVSNAVADAPPKSVPPSESRPEGISAKLVEPTAKTVKASSQGPGRGLPVPIKVTRTASPIQARGEKKTMRQKETAVASADEGHVAKLDLPEFFPGAKGVLDTGRKELLPRATHVVAAERRMSPEMLEQMLQTEVARLEETGAIEHEIASLEHARGIALAHQETVSVARLLEEERNAQERNERADRMYREQQEKLKETVERLTREVAADVRKESLEQIRTVADVFAREVRKGAAQQHPAVINQSGQPFRSESRLADTEGGARLAPTDHSPEDDALHQLRFYSSDESESESEESTRGKDGVTSDMGGAVPEETGSIVQSQSYSRAFEQIESDIGVSERVSEPASGGVDATIGERIVEGFSENMSESVRGSAGQGVSQKISERVSERVSEAVGKAEDDISERIGSRVSERVSGGVEEEAESRLRNEESTLAELVEEKGLVETEVDLQWKDLKVVDDNALADGAFVEEEVLDELEVAEEGPVEEDVGWGQAGEQEVGSQDGEERGLENVGMVETEETIKEERQHYSDSFGESVGAQMPSSGGSPEDLTREQIAPGESESRGTDERETAAQMLRDAAEKLRTAEEALFEKKRTLEERTRGEIAALGRSADRKAAVRQQKLMRLRLDADLADVDRALASMRAEFVRQRLAWEQGSDASAVRRFGESNDPDGVTSRAVEEEGAAAGADVSAVVSSAIPESETRNTAGESVGEEVDTEVGSQSAAQCGSGSGVSEEIESGPAEENGLDLREAVEISATAFSSIAVRRIEIELERARAEAAALQKEKREREIQDEIQWLNDAVTKKRAAIMAASAPPTPAAQIPKPWAPLAEARPLPPLEPLHVSGKPLEPSQSASAAHSEPTSVAYSDSFLGAESAGIGSSRRESDVPSEALSVGDQDRQQLSSGVAEKDDSVRYSDTFDQAGESEPVASVATESGDGTNARWDEEVTSAMQRSVTSANRHATVGKDLTDGRNAVPEDDVRGAGRDVTGRVLDSTGLRQEASWGQVIDMHGTEVLGKEVIREITGEVSKNLTGEVTGEEELLEELPEEWSGESTGVARGEAERDQAVESASLEVLNRAFDASQISAGEQFQGAGFGAEAGPENPERVQAGVARPAESREVRRLSEAVGSEPDEYSDSFASEADAEDDVSSAPMHDTWPDDFAREGGEEADGSGRALAGLEDAKGLEGLTKGLGRFAEGLGDEVGAWETEESPGPTASASMFATLKRTRGNVLGTAGKDDFAEVETEITGVEGLEEVDEELEFDEDGFVSGREGEDGAEKGSAAVGGTDRTSMRKGEESASAETGDDMGRLRGVGKERLVKAADAVLKDLVAAEVEDATASPPVSPTRRIRTRLLNPQTLRDGEGAGTSPPSPRSPGSPSRPVFDSEARWINPQNLSPRNSPRSSPPLHVPLGIGPLGPFEQDASAAAASHSPHSPDSPTRQSLRASFEAAQNPETLVGMSRLSAKDFAELSRESPLPEELEEGFEDLEPNPLAVEGDAAYVEDYVSEVLRVSGFLEPGAAAWYRPNQPLGLDVFVRLEKMRPDVHDFQHIFNKLIFDAVGEALLKELTPYKPREPLERAPKPLKPPPDAAALLAAVRTRTLAIFKRRAPVGPLKEEALRLMMKEQPWVGFPEEELEVGCEVADLMVNDMVDEVVELLLRAQRGRQSKRQALMKAGGRSSLGITL